MPTHERRDDRSCVLRSQAGDEDARTEVTRRYQPLVLATASRLHRPSDRHRHDDVVSTAQVGLQKAINDFDADRAVPFAAYAKAKVHGEVMRWMRDSRYVVHVPRTLHERAMQVHRVQRDLEAAGMQRPRVEDVATTLGLTVEEVLEALAVNSAERSRAAQLHHVMQTHRESPAADLFLDLQYLRSEDRRLLWERHVMGRTQAEVGELLHLSQGQVSRREAKLLDRLRVALRHDPH